MDYVSMILSTDTYIMYIYIYKNLQTNPEYKWSVWNYPAMYIRYDHLIMGILFYSDTPWRTMDTHHTVDGCEILHQLIDGKHPIIYDKHPIIYRLLSILFGGAGFCNRPQYLHDSFKLNSPRRCWIPWLMDFFEGPQDATKYAPWSKYGICFIVIHTI